MASRTKRTKELYAKLYEDPTDADITFVGDGKKVKAHKAVLSASCDYFKHSFRENKASVINVDGTFLKLLKEVVKYCYLQQIDIADWSYDDKESLHKLAADYKYTSLMDIVKRELDKRPEVPLSVDTLNEWHKNSPGKELREWIKNNSLNIANYEDCHKYTKDLMLFILPIFYKMVLEDSNKQLTVQKKVLQWLLRWKNWCHRKEEDVHSVFSNLEVDLMINERPAWERPLAVKLSKVVHDFEWFKEVKTDGWNRDEVLELMCFAHVYGTGQLLDAVLNIVTTQHLEPSSFATLYGLARKLDSSKLELVLVDYSRKNAKSIITSAEFTKYSTSVVEFIFENLTEQVMDVETKSLCCTFMKKWRDSNSDKEVVKFLNNIKWQDFLGKLCADLFIKGFNDDGSNDVTFLIGNQEIKAHKTVLADVSNSFKQLFDRNKDSRIKINVTPVEKLYQVIQNCYLRKIDFKHWNYSGKKHLLDLATKYNYQPLMDLVKTELETRPKVPLGVASLNEWYGNCPDEEIREWVQNNLLTIVNYEDCHKYCNELVVLIMDTFCELADKESDKEKLEIPLKKLLLWLFRWRNSSIRKEKDVQRVFAKIRLPLVFKDRAFGNKTLQEKLFVAVRQFCQMREVDTADWTCEDVLKLLYFAHDYEFGPLVDSLANTIATQNLEPTCFGPAPEGKRTKREQSNNSQFRRSVRLRKE